MAVLITIQLRHTNSPSCKYDCTLTTVYGILCWLAKGLITTSLQAIGLAYNCDPLHFYKTMKEKKRLAQHSICWWQYQILTLWISGGDMEDARPTRKTISNVSINFILLSSVKKILSSAACPNDYNATVCDPWSFIFMYSPFQTLIGITCWGLHVCRLQ